MVKLKDLVVPVKTRKPRLSSSETDVTAPAAVPRDFMNLKTGASEVFWLWLRL